MQGSVLLPVYNGAPTLRETLASLQAQTFTDFEILIANDCSKDKSLQIIKDYARNDSRVRVFNWKTNMGLAKTLNELARAAQTPYLIRLDQDDICHPNRIGKQIAFMNANPSVAAAGSHIFHMGKTPEKDHLIELPISSEDIHQTMRSYNCLYHPATIIRKSAFEAVGGYREAFKNAEDYDLWLRLSRQFPLRNIPEPLLRYRFSTTGMTLSRKWEQLYFVNLAQIADKHPELELAELHSLAEKAHVQMGKKEFLKLVYVGTIKELQRLGFRIAAWRMVKKSFADISYREGFRQAWQLFRHS